MSNPFYGLLPVYLPYSGTTDASGNFTKVLRPRAGFWFTGKLINEVAGGFPAVRVSDGAIPLGFGRGIRAEVAGLMAPPNASLVLEVLGAQPSIAVKGSLVGVQGPDMASIVQALTTAPNTVAVDVATPSQVAGKLNVSTGVAVSQSFAIPPGTVAVGCTIIGNAGSPPGSVSAIPPAGLRITGDQSGIRYVDVTPANTTPAGLWIGQITNDMDTSCTLRVSDTGGATSAAVFSQLLTFSDHAVVQVRAPQGQEVAVTEASATPAQWQASLSSAALSGVALTINTDFTIVAATAGQRISVHSVHLMTNSSAFTSVELWDGPSATGVLIGALANDGTAVGAVPMTWDGKGRRGTVGNALVGRATNMSVGSSIWGAIGYNQQ